jgi:sugar lactone lactonase YvrE
VARDAPAGRFGDAAVTERLSVPDVVVRARAEVGEGPVFDARSGRLCWVDINNRTLFETDLRTGDQTETDVGLVLGAAVPREREEGFAVAVADGLGLWTGTLDLQQPVLPEPHRRMNDAKCDSRGRLWAGSTHVAFEPGQGALHCWDGRGPSRVVWDGFVLPNGIGWTAEDDTMFFADTFAYRLYRADFDADEGELAPFSVHCAFGAHEWPDGLAVDVDGCVWVAFWGSSEVRRISPSGEVIAVVPMPVKQPSSCAFGDDGTLYITSASAGLSEEELVQQPLAGSVFAVATSTHGVPVHAFAA